MTWLPSRGTTASCSTCGGAIAFDGEQWFHDHPDLARGFALDGLHEAAPAC